MATKKELYTVEDGKIVRKNPFCPRCSEGVFMADHEFHFTHLTLQVLALASCHHYAREHLKEGFPLWTPDF